MTFFANLDFATAYHFISAWQVSGYRTRIVRQSTGRYLAARLESWSYKA